MANKIGFKVDNIDFWIKKLNEKNKDLKEVTDKALVESKKIVNDKLIRDTVDSNFPAGGRYSTPRHIVNSSINKQMNTEWSGYVDGIKIGYDFNVSGLISIFLMYGTAKMRPAKKLKNDIYGSATRNEIKKKQEEVIVEFLLK